MTGLLRSELIKLRTTRTAMGFAIAALLLVLASVLLQTLLGDPQSVEDKRSVIGGAGAVTAVLLVFGAVGATGEHRHGTITPALLIAPDRVRVTVAKLLGYALAGAVVALLVQVLAVGLGLALMSGQSGPDLSVQDILEVSAGGIAACALMAALGVGIGALVRNQVAAVVGALVYVFILESVIAGVASKVYAYTIGGTSGVLSGMTGDELLSPWLAALVLFGWTVAVGAAAVLADRARDVN
jgi:ABC-type transport system involved in multi-copper enzyme maturation permease subunit